MIKNVAVGIDLGAANSCVAVSQNGQVDIIENDMNSRITPSFVAFTETERLIGNIAKNQADICIKSTIYDVKIILGRQYDFEYKNESFWPLKILKVEGKFKIKAQYKSGERLFAPEEIIAMQLTNLKETAKANVKQEIENIVVSVPAFFNDLQRQAILDAGYIAGLNVSLINEPVAAALAYRYYKQNLDGKTVLFFDFGYGKLEVSIVKFQADSRYNFEIKSSAHNTHLGGADLDRKMVNYLLNEFERKHSKNINDEMKSYRRLLTAWENAKIVLSSNDKALINIYALFGDLDFTIEVTREKFETICKDQLEAIIEPVKMALDSALITKGEIDEIVLIGGSTRIPKVQELIRSFFDEKELIKSLNADEAIAIGAALQSDKTLENNTNKYVTDIISYSLNCATDEKDMILIFQNGTQIGLDWHHTFHTKEDNQTEMTFSFYQDCPAKPDINICLCTYTYTDIPPARKGTKIISLKCKIDNNGFLELSLQDQKSSEWKTIEIKKTHFLLSQEELQGLRKEEENLQEEEKKQIEKSKIIYEFETLLYSTKPEKKSQNYQDWSDNITWLKGNRQAETNEIKVKLQEYKEKSPLRNKSIPMETN